jgi:hypothetical protein
VAAFLLRGSTDARRRKTPDYHAMNPTRSKAKLLHGRLRLLVVAVFATALPVGGAVPAHGATPPLDCTKKWLGDLVVERATFLNATLWSPAGVPGSTDVVCFEKPGTVLSGLGLSGNTADHIADIGTLFAPPPVTLLNTFLEPRLFGSSLDISGWILAGEQGFIRGPVHAAPGSVVIAAAKQSGIYTFETMGNVRLDQVKIEVMPGARFDGLLNGKAIVNYGPGSNGGIVYGAETVATVPANSPKLELDGRLQEIQAVGEGCGVLVSQRTFLDVARLNTGCMYVSARWLVVREQLPESSLSKVETIGLRYGGPQAAPTFAGSLLASRGLVLQSNLTVLGTADIVTPTSGGWNGTFNEPCAVASIENRGQLRLRPAESVTGTALSLCALNVTNNGTLTAAGQVMLGPLFNTTTGTLGFEPGATLRVSRFTNAGSIRVNLPTAAPVITATNSVELGGSLTAMAIVPVPVAQPLITGSLIVGQFSGVNSLARKVVLSYGPTAVSARTIS